MRYLISGILCFCFLSTYAQKTKLHSTDEILKLMTDSKIAYELEMLEKKIEPIDRSSNLNFNNVYRISNDKGFSTRTYKESEALLVLHNKAEAYFVKNDYANARLYYKKTLELDSTYYKDITYVGQTYRLEGDKLEAEKWYKKAVGLNYIDYMAHWFLASMYSERNERELALNEILTAHILNRNNPRILEAMKKIVNQNKREYADWAFTPQYELEKITDSKIRIRTDILWMGYANAKALWAYEPGFKESMGFEKDQQFVQPEDKDALLALAVLGQVDKEHTKTDDIKALIYALDKGYINEYLFYEIYLPKMPSIGYQLPDDFMKSIIQYIKDVRLK